MTHKTDRELLEEIHQRAVRTETRVLQLGDHVGANLRTKQRIDIEATAHCSVVAYIDALDVSLSRVIAEVNQSPLWEMCKPGMHMVQIRLGTRRDHVVVGEVAVMCNR